MNDPKNGDNPSGASPRFGHINDSYSNIFTAFSGERMFSPIGSNIIDLEFFVPGTNIPAVVRGFGAVYAEVDTEIATRGTMQAAYGGLSLAGDA